MAEVPQTFQLTVTLEGIRPPIWRRLVSGSATLDDLHQALQVAMGWEDSHLHCFRVGGVRYSSADDEDFDTDEIDETSASVGHRSSLPVLAGPKL